MVRTPDPGRESRKARVRGGQGGSWASSSQDFVRLAGLLYKLSAEYATAHDGNISIYALAGFGPLFSALRCLLIELNGGMYGELPRQDVLDELALASNDVRVIFTHYAVPDGLRTQLSLLLDVRNEIVHPAHSPGGDDRNTPAYLEPLRASGLLQSTGDAADYTWISQLQSHRLFRWGFATVRETVGHLLANHSVSDLSAEGLGYSYAVYERIDAA